MTRLTRTPLLLSVTAMLAADASSLVAQRSDVVVRRTAPPRAESGDSGAWQLRRLERRADSLAHMYNEGEDLRAAERRRIGDALDRTVEQIEQLSLRMAEAGERTGAARTRDQAHIPLSPMISDAARSFMRRVLTEAQAVMPRGWLGIVVSGTAREPRVENGELIIRYVTHPEIVSVEPSSPAEQAGLTPSDTLIAYDGQDVRDSDISLTRLLRPNARVLVRIRRDGRTRDVPVTIADVPQRISLRRELTVEMPVMPPFSGLPNAPSFPRSPAMQRRPASMSRAPGIPPTGLVPLPPVPPLGLMAPAAYGFSVSGVAGAQLVAVTRGLGRSLGVRRGVLVANAPVGSPAYQSGLRDGDVIRKVASVEVRTVGDVRDRVASAIANSDRAVDVQYLRDKRTRTLLLRWDR